MTEGSADGGQHQSRHIWSTEENVIGLWTMPVGQSYWPNITDGPRLIS